ncbi:MAG TPA: holo-ACP synthase [Gemmatimonadales bacterium]|jgi:holo-[acyl-carrier protein] synthase|nr:holo-ACP synthase [Gemmatimonadales bacterium]
MIVGIGMDVVEIRRIRDLAQRHAAFLTRTFAPCELHHCQEKVNPYPHLAARFAAKEAVFKALGTGWSMGLQWTDVAVENNAAGKPAIRLSGAARRLAEQLGANKIHLSLTHTGRYAGAQVVLERLPLHPVQSDQTEISSTTHGRCLPSRQTGLAQ